MADWPIFATTLHVLIALVGTVAFALALGAVWMAVMLHIPSARYWFAIPIGYALGFGIRAWITPSRLGAMLLAASGTVLAAVYMQCLLAGLKLAAVMGLGKLEALSRAGAGMLLALASAAFNWRDLLPLLIGMAVAMWAAWRQHARAEGSSD